MRRALAWDGESGGAPAAVLALVELGGVVRGRDQQLGEAGAVGEQVGLEGLALIEDPAASTAAAVPLPRDQVVDLMVEFMTSVAALIGDTGSPACLRAWKCS